MSQPQLRYQSIVSITSIRFAVNERSAFIIVLFDTTSVTYIFRFFLHVWEPKMPFKGAVIVSWGCTNKTDLTWLTYGNKKSPDFCTFTHFNLQWNGCLPRKGPETICEAKTNVTLKTIAKKWTDLKNKTDDLCQGVTVDGSTWLWNALSQHCLCPVTGSFIMVMVMTAKPSVWATVHPVAMGVYSCGLWVTSLARFRWNHLAASEPCNKE